LKRLVLALEPTSISVAACVVVCGGRAADVDVDVEMWLLKPLLLEVLVRRTKRFMRCRREEVRVIVCDGRSGVAGSAGLVVVVLGFAEGVLVIEYF